MPELPPAPLSRAPAWAGMLKIPAFFVLAVRDELVPSALGERRFARCPGPKALWRDSRAGHHDIPGGPEAPWRPEAGRFFAGHR